MLGRSLRNSAKSCRLRNSVCLLNVKKNLHTSFPAKRRNNAEMSQFNRINSKLTEQLAALDEMTKQVKDTLKIKKEEKEVENLKDSVGINQSEINEEDIDNVFKSLAASDLMGGDDVIGEKLPLTNEKIKVEPTVNTDSDNLININDESDLMTLFPQPKPYVSLPSSIVQVLTPQQISSITREETANWEPVIDALLNSSICDPTSTTVVSEEFTSFDFHKLIVSIPRKHKIQVVEKLHELALRSGVVWGNVFVMNHLIALCSLLPKVKADIIINALLSDIQMKHDDESPNEVVIRDGNEKIVANKTTKGILLNHYARMSNVPKVRELIGELNKLPDSRNPMKTSPIIYTSIMQMYMRLDNYNLAKETFDTMKFLSLSTSPSPRTYTSMILLDTINNNIEHGISVYEEMKDKGIKVESQALLALAKGCGARRGLISRGWDFIIQYYQEGYPVNSQIMEIMMYLAYVDGDLPFVRGIWLNICETNTKLQGTIQLPHSKCTKWLFNTYYKVGELSDAAAKGERHVPVGLTDPRVRSIRTKVLELVNFKFHPNAPPLLPISNMDGSDSKLMLSEARALWNYIIDNGKLAHISEELVEAYLYVVGRYAPIDTFQQEWERLTIFDNQGIEDEQHIEIEEPEQEQEAREAVASSTQLKSCKSSTELPIGRVLRTDRLYNMCMHIARHQGNLSFAQKIWKERGRYRKGTKFQKLSITKQDAADFKFARLMMSTLTFTGNIGDAYKLVLSSQNRFVWTKYHLKSLMSVCERMGYVTFSRELLTVIKRSDKWIRRQQKRQ